MCTVSPVGGTRLSKNALSYWGIGGLAVLTAAVSLAALLQHRPTTEAQPAPAAATPITTPAAVQPTPIETPSPSATPSPTPEPLTLARVADIINSPDGASIMVIGDGSGDENDEWVALWARNHLAEHATVTYRYWDHTKDEYSAPVKRGSSGPAIELWNASIRSPNMAEEPSRVAEAWQDADVVFLSYGHRRTADKVAGQLDDVVAAIRAEDPDVPVVTIIQNPGPARSDAVQRETTLAIQEWADTEGFPTIDIYSAFMADSTPRSALVESDGSPTAEGSRLFAMTLNQEMLSKR